MEIICDFTVYLENETGKEIIADHIIKIKRDQNNIILMDFIGEKHNVPSATVELVDTLMQEIILKN